MSARVPTRGAMSPASGATIIGASVHGEVCSAASSGVAPCTTCRNWMRMKIDPNAPKLNPNPTTFATEKLRSRNSRSGSSGAGARASQSTNASQQDAAADEAAEHLEAVPARLVAAHDAVDEAEQPEAREHEAHDVGTQPGAEAVRQREQGQRDRDHADGHVDPEDRLPGPALDHGAADERPGRDAEAGDAAPDADRERTPRERHRPGEQGERERHDRRGAEALQCARGDELAGVGGEGGERRAQREHDDADEEERAPAEAVAEGDGHEDRARERERVRVHEPLQLFDGCPELLVQHGQGVRHHEVVERGHEHRQGGREEHEPQRARTTAGGARRSRRGGGFEGG